MPAAAGGSLPGVSNPGSQTALRQRNERRIVEALTAFGDATQVEISHHTGLSAATVSNIVKTMAERGVVITTPTTRSGRRALSVRLNARGAVAIGIDFGRRHVRVALASYRSTLIDEHAVNLPAGNRATASIDAACALVARLVEKNGVDARSVLGIGVGIPTPIDRRTWTAVSGVNLPEWEGVQILDEVQQRVSHPVYLDNDANVGALAQVTWGAHQSVDNLVFLKIGSGIGCGLIIGGAVFYGHIGVTGEIGHATVDPHGPICWCGNRGCLETIASTATMIDRLDHSGTVKLTTENIVDNANRGDPATLRVIEDAGMAVGQALADVADLLNPEVIVIGGPVTGLGEILLTPIRRGLMRNALPIVSETTPVVMSPLGVRAEVLGAAALVLQHASAPV